jgi:hypothetical protein
LVLPSGLTRDWADVEEGIAAALACVIKDLLGCLLGPLVVHALSGEPNVTKLLVKSRQGEGL